MNVRNNIENNINNQEKIFKTGLKAILTMRVIPNILNKQKVIFGKIKKEMYLKMIK